MAATAAAVVAEEDTELRDLLVQTLENSGVLNRIKVRRGTGSWRVGGGPRSRAAGPVWTRASQRGAGRDGGAARAGVRAAGHLGGGPRGGPGSVTGSPGRCGSERTKGPSRL